MFQKLWRLSHLCLALGAGLFIFLAAITGLVLATEPVIAHSEASSFHNLDALDLEESLTKIKAEYPEIMSLKRNAFNQVSVEILDDNFESQSFYINPFTGEKIAEIAQRSAVFEFTTVLHRSLFLKSTGRFLVGLSAFFLALIIMSGFALLLKRYGGLKKLVRQKKYDATPAYWHSLASKYFFIPLLIIALSGVYLSAERFAIKSQPEDVWDFENKEVSDADEVLNLKDITAFDTYKVADIVQVDFPFSSAPDAYFYLKLTEAELLVDQFSGKAMHRVSQSLPQQVKKWSFHLHTGDFSWVWSLVLGLSSLVIIGLFISGLLIWIKRKTKSKGKNSCQKDDAEFIILVGSETGSTFSFASRLAEALINAQKKVYVTDLNHYTTFKSAKYMLILTSTYGDGEAPFNASKFIQKLDQTNQKLFYAVLGFGSSDYPKFCAFAKYADQKMRKQALFKTLLGYATVNKNNEVDFQNWYTQLSQTLKIPLDVKPPKEANTTLKIQDISCLNCDQNFTLCLKTNKIDEIKSGDLLAITPKADGKERLYSIAKFDNKVLLSVKKHDLGICSTYLSQLNKNTKFKAKIRKHPKFHLDQKKNVIFIANGTGIAPFLGMIDEASPTQEMHVFFGLRNTESYALYQDYFSRNADKVKQMNLAYSREHNKAEYVQHLITRHPETVINCLQNDGCIMICGSLAMEKEVKKAIDQILEEKLLTNINKYSSQILCDCY